MEGSSFGYNTVSGSFSLGGAINAGVIFASLSSIDHNSALGQTSEAGAIYSNGNVVITDSLVSNNHAQAYVGGLALVNGSPLTKTVTITNSTISGNSTDGLVGGMYSDAAKVSISNSTIAFNTAGNGGSAPFYAAPGIALYAEPNSTITLQSSILSNNVYGSKEEDISMSGFDPLIGGGNNLIFAATHASVPGDTLKLTCPLLGPLRDNGGFTSTHALASNSPAINAGNNLGQLSYDQRATGNPAGATFVRVSGGQADIGAYELQPDEIVLSTGFDGCADP